MKKNLWKLVLVSSICAVSLGLNNGERVSATENPAMLGNQLIAVARINNLDGVQMSIVAGANVNARDSDGRTALDSAKIAKNKYVDDKSKREVYEKINEIKLIIQILIEIITNNQKISIPPA